MDVTANLVTADQLTAWMHSATGSDRANQDQWCYALANITGSPCPVYDIGNGPNVLTSAQVFLDGLRDFQLGINASTQGPGGTQTIAGAGTTPIPPTSGPSGASTVGVGLLGPTNCKVCIWLKQNPLALVLIAVGIYFAFFYKD